MKESSDSYSVLYLLLALTSTSLLSNCQILETKLSAVKLPGGPRIGMTPFYDGEGDDIYLFGGVYYNNPDDLFDKGIGYDSILRYTISTDTIEEVGKLPLNVTYGSATADSFGNIYHIGGYHSDEGSLSRIFQYSPNSSSVVEVAMLPTSQWKMFSVQSSRKSIVLGGYQGRREILEFDQETMTTSNIGTIPVPNSAYERFTTDGVVKGMYDNVFLFGCSYDFFFISRDGCDTVLNYSIPLNSFTSGRRVIPPLVKAHFAHSNNDGRLIYFMNRDGKELVIYDMDFDRYVIPKVNNFPGNSPAEYFLTSIVYVKKMDRLYIFGGSLSRPVYMDDIWYIDLKP